MSAHRLAPHAEGARTEDAPPPPVAPHMERAVLQVLNGTLLHHTATAEQLIPAELAEAVEAYRQAGRQALGRQEASGWWQVYLEFGDWTAAEQVAADIIGPLLGDADETGLVRNWWFMRKFPCWRLRIHPGADSQAMRSHLAVAFDQFVADGRIARWWPGIYEAETAAFGGPDGMATAHELFCADSRAVLRLVRDSDPGMGRRELSVLLCGILMRAAGVEWYEQGDAWHRVAQERPLPADVPPAKLTTMAGDLTQLMVADTTPGGPLFAADGPLASVAAWADAFWQAGWALGDAARAGTLGRGLRDVLSYAVIFHWNRLGLSARTQSILAWAAHTAILGPPPPTAANRATDRQATNTSEMAAPDAATSAEGAEHRMVARFPLVARRRFRCPDLETQVRTVQECANSCHEPGTAEERINRACTVWNLSALIAADCGQSGLAVELCRRQFAVFRSAAPVSGVAVIPLLQPLVNLARLTRRAGDPQRAYRELDAINHAVYEGGSVTLHGEQIDFDGLILDRPSTVESWLRDVLRDEGTRALVAAGQWTNAARHSSRYDEAGGQLREARQTRIIELTLGGHIGAALDLVDTAVTTEHWEHAVAACLRGYAHLKSQGLDAADIATMLGAVRHARRTSDRPTTLFCARLGMAAADLMVAAGSDASPLCTELVQDAQRSDDAFVARDVLAHAECRVAATPEQAAALGALVERAGLAAGYIPEHALSELMRSVAVAESVLADTLDTMASSRSRT